MKDELIDDIDIETFQNLAERLSEVNHRAFRRLFKERVPISTLILLGMLALIREGEGKE